MTEHTALQGRHVLITGGAGQLASDLEALLRDVCDVSAPARAELDISDDTAVAAAFERQAPAVVFNCAAFHNVEVCEREEDRSFAVNARAVKRLAERCAQSGSTFVHLSTNYVFGGDSDDPYSETDRPSARSIYAISKLAGEHAALAYCPDVLVARTSGLYGRHGSASKGGNFVQRMLARAREQGALKMVADQRLTPTYTADLAQALVAAVETDVRGLLHVTNAGSCSWHEFTLAIMELAGADVAVDAVPTVRQPGAADRPLNGVLSCERAHRSGLPGLRPWRAALEEYMVSAGLAAAPAAR
jgi:dTDP-4-dehydrorhamnose reductase